MVVSFVSRLCAGNIRGLLLLLWLSDVAEAKKYVQYRRRPRPHRRRSVVALVIITVILEASLIILVSALEDRIIIYSRDNSLFLTFISLAILAIFSDVFLLFVGLITKGRRLVGAAA